MQVILLEAMMRVSRSTALVSLAAATLTVSTHAQNVRAAGTPPGLAAIREGDLRRDM